MASFGKGLAIKPDRASAWANLGDILALQGKDDMAVASYINTFRFSQNREKTYDYFQNQQSKEGDAKQQGAIKRAIEKAERDFPLID